MKFYPYKKNHAEGGHNKFLGSFSHKEGGGTKSFHFLKGGGGTRKVLPCQGWGGGRKKFRTCGFPILNY